MRRMTLLITGEVHAKVAKLKKILESKEETNFERRNIFLRKL